MSTFKKITLGLLASSLILTFGFGKQSDMEYECKTEKNSLSCINIIYEKAGNEAAKKGSDIAGAYNISWETEYRKMRAKSKVYIKAFREAAKYCKDENGWFFSDKKANKINGIACQYVAGIYLANSKMSPDMKEKPQKWLDIDLLLKTLNTGCDIDNVQSCLMLFDIYHPRYITEELAKRTKKSINKIIKPDLERAIGYYRRGCEDKSKKWHKTNLYLHYGIDSYNPKCIYDKKYLQD